jgi:hypothetical protein
VNDLRTTTDDLAWWFDFASGLEWTFAKTYADSAPHDYVVAGRTLGVTQEDLARAAKVIHTFGSPGKYYSVTKIYLVSPDGQYRWCTEDERLGDTDLVNRAATDRLYGVQNAPATRAPHPTDYDPIAASWDEVNSITAAEAERAKQCLTDVRGTYPPHALDIGCGTGRVLDLGLVSPERCAAVDSSQAMLNMLVRKHPRVAAVYPRDIRELLADGTFTADQFDWVFLDASVELTSPQQRQVERLARLALITVDRGLWTCTPRRVPARAVGPESSALPARAL